MLDAGAEHHYGVEIWVFAGFIVNACFNVFGLVDIPSIAKKKTGSLRVIGY